MNPSIGAISKWKYLLLLKLWWNKTKHSTLFSLKDLIITKEWSCSPVEKNIYKAEEETVSNITRILLKEIIFYILDRHIWV